MTVYEQELRKLFEHSDLVDRPQFSGRVCVGDLGKDLRVRVEFLSTHISSQYDAIRLTVLNRTEGVVDRTLLRFQDVWGKKQVPNNPNFRSGVIPHLWDDYGKVEWYAYHPTAADYAALRDAVGQYLSAFRERTPELERSGPKLVYICAPLRGDVTNNVEFARQKAQEVFAEGNIPTETLQSIARKHLCQLTTLNWQQADGLVTALPLGLRRIDALRTLTTEALAVLMPFKAQEIWDRGGVYYGQNAISKNLIVADRRQLLNGNAFILGVSGSGKSFSAKKEMVSLALSTQDDIIVIDPESEYRPLIEGLGGQVINISAASPNHINAMDMEQGYGDGENPVVLKSEFLLSLCEQLIGAGKLSAKEKSVIDRCTAQVYRDYIRGGYQGQAPTLQDFHAELLRQPEKEAQDVALAIELFTDGSLNTFAKPTNVDTNARILCYDIRDLGKQLLPVGMLVVLDSIFNRIIRNRGLKRNTWIYIDEIYLLFQHEYSANFLFTLWKRMRKYQACGTGISQNIEDLLQSHTARTMLANSEFLIMLNQAATDREELARLLNISDNQLSYITNVDSGRGLIKCGSAIVPFVDHFPKNKLYRLMTTKPSDLAA